SWPARSSLILASSLASSTIISAMRCDLAGSSTIAFSNARSMVCCMTSPSISAATTSAMPARCDAAGVHSYADEHDYLQSASMFVMLVVPVDRTLVTRMGRITGPESAAALPNVNDTDWPPSMMTANVADAATVPSHRAVVAFDRSLLLSGVTGAALTQDPPSAHQNVTR